MTNSEKVAFISGSTKGIGKVIAAGFAEKGYKVIQNSRNKVSKEDLLGFMHILGDVTNYESCLEIAKTIKSDYGRLDVLVCNVGNGLELDSGIATKDRWSHFLSMNLLSTTFLVDAALPLLLKSKGNVVALSSICGSSIVKGAPIEYSVAKSALNAYIKSMAYKHGPDGIRFNAIAPGNVLFEGSTWQKKIEQDQQLINKFINENVPLGLFVLPDAVAEMVLFLASDISKFTTGAVFNIDGGQSL